MNPKPYILNPKPSPEPYNPKPEAARLMQWQLPVLDGHDREDGNEDAGYEACGTGGVDGDGDGDDDDDDDGDGDGDGVGDDNGDYEDFADSNGYDSGVDNDRDDGDEDGVGDLDDDVDGDGDAYAGRTQRRRGVMQRPFCDMWHTCQCVSCGTHVSCDTHDAAVLLPVY